MNNSNTMVRYLVRAGGLKVFDMLGGRTHYPGRNTPIDNLDRGYFGSPYMQNTAKKLNGG